MPGPGPAGRTGRGEAGKGRTGTGPMTPPRTGLRRTVGPPPYAPEHGCDRRPPARRRPSGGGPRPRCRDRPDLSRRSAGLEEATGPGRGGPAADRGRHRALRARALPGERRDDEQQDPHPQPQDPRPARRGRRRAGRPRADRARRPHGRRRRPRGGLRQLAQDLRAGVIRPAGADREHRWRGQRDGPAAGPDRPAVGRGRRVRARLLPGHLSRARRRRGAAGPGGPGQGDHRPDRPGARERLPGRVRLRRRPARQPHRRAHRPGRGGGGLRGGRRAGAGGDARAARGPGRGHRLPAGAAGQVTLDAVRRRPDLVLFAVLATTALGILLGYLGKAPCSGPPYDAYGISANLGLHKYDKLCYSDVQQLWVGRGVREHTFPYVQGSLQETDRPEGLLVDGAVEYPVVTGVFMWFAGLFASDDGQYLAITALLLAPFGLLTAGLLATLSGARAFVWAAAPALVLYSVHNWDFLATATVVGAVWAWSRGKIGLAAALLGLGAATKIYPGFFALPLLLERLQARDPRGAAKVAAGTGGVWLLLNLPFLLVNPDGWWATYEFQTGRIADLTTNSVWFWGLPDLQ